MITTSFTYYCNGTYGLRSILEAPRYEYTPANRMEERELAATTAKAVPDGQEPSIRSILAPLVAIIVGLFMVILDGTAMNVALPGFVTEFGKDLSVVQWTVTGYALAQAAVIPLAGWLSDRFGAKKIFLISVAMFTLGSLLCALAADVNQLIIYRVIQGIGGGMVMPIAMAFTYRLSPPGKVGAVMGMMGIPILLAPALGPVIAGWLVDYASWKWIFLLNLPVGIIGILIGLRTLPNIDRQSVPALDMAGIILGPIAFAGLSYGVSEGGNSWTSAQTLTGLIVGGAALIGFVIAELRRENPLLELRVFKSSDFTRGIIVQWISQIALFGTLFMIPLFLVMAKQYTAFETGLVMLPQALAAGLFMPIGGKLFDKIGARPLVISGMSLVLLAAFLLSRIQMDDSVWAMVPPLALLGAGMGLSMMPLNTHLMQSAPQNLVSRVTSLTNAAQQVMTSFAVAGLTTIHTTLTKDYITDGTDPAKAGGLAFGDTFYVLVGIAVLGILIAFFLRKPKNAAQNTGQQPEVAMVMH
ncbi:DHA2 family efflux MFS transporter permease subunit [Paenibacillus gansuensis]|uniref:DHA2 family efflux MFS transporter permease subunit n=1 Tax=Paenibacillus gansuensis TaxID=306542 RepID=A0ABW5PK59_9BACL